MITFREHTVLGVRVNPLSAEELTAYVSWAVESGGQRIVAHHNLHSIYLHQRDSKLETFYERADCCPIDGMPLVLAGRLVGLPLRRVHRVTYIDWMPGLMEQAARNGWRVTYLGSTPEALSRGIDVLSRQHPKLQISGLSGYFDANPGSADNATILHWIREKRPHLLLVGMGMPRQEHWVLENLSRLPACVILTCGAALDLVAGVIPIPPRWAGRWSLEWMFRLLAEPRKVWRRYLVEPWAILLTIAFTDVARRIQVCTRAAKR